MAGTAKGTAKGKANIAGHKTEPDEVQRRQPAWRQPPAKPRKRTRRNAFAAPARPAGPSRRSRSEPRTFAMPSREFVLNALRVAAVLVFAAAMVTGLVYMLSWPALNIGPGTTLIGGAHRIDPAVIFDKSEIDGSNILLLRSDEIEARLLAVPGVAQASVHLRLPNAAIIDIVEHSPLVAWQAMTSTVWLAADGSEVPQSGAQPPLQLVDQTGGKLAASAGLKALIMENLKALRETSVQVSELYYGNTQGLYYRAPEGWEVWLGESGDMREKVALADSAGRDLAQAGRRPKVVDVRLSNRKAMWW